MTDSDLWLRRFHPAPDAATRLLCLPHAGGSASYYFPVSRALSPDIEVLAVQYPGRQDRHSEPCIDSVEGLADRLVPALRPFLDRPLTIFGHSLGATLGFEVALRLEQAGVVPTALFASGRRAPSRVRDERSHLLDDAGLVADIKALNGTEASLLDDEDILRMVLPAVRGDYRAAELYRYRPGPKLNCPVYAFIGDADPKVTVDEANAWRAHSACEFELTVFAGGHFYLNAHVPEILERIKAHTSTIPRLATVAESGRPVS